jgi:hypothetical protein
LPPRMISRTSTSWVPRSGQDDRLPTASSILEEHQRRKGWSRGQCGLLGRMAVRRLPESKSGYSYPTRDGS